MKRSVSCLFVVAGLCALSIACEKPGQAERQKETSAMEQAANARNQAREQAVNAQAAAENDIAAARTSFAKAREEYVHGRRLDVITLDGRIMDLEARARTATGKAKADIDMHLPAIRAERDGLVRRLQALEAEAATTWDADKSSFDKEWDSLKSQVDKLD